MERRGSWFKNEMELDEMKTSLALLFFLFFLVCDWVGVFLFITFLPLRARRIKADDVVELGAVLVVAAAKDIEERPGLDIRERVPLSQKHKQTKQQRKKEERIEHHCPERLLAADSSEFFLRHHFSLSLSISLHFSPFLSLLSF